MGIKFDGKTNADDYKERIRYELIGKIQEAIGSLRAANDTRHRILFYLRSKGHEERIAVLPSRLLELERMCDEEMSTIELMSVRVRELLK